MIKFFYCIGGKIIFYHIQPFFDTSSCIFIKRCYVCMTLHVVVLVMLHEESKGSNYWPVTNEWMNWGESKSAKFYFPILYFTSHRGVIIAIPLHSDVLSGKIT